MKKIQKMIVVLLACWMAASPAVVQAQAIPIVNSQNIRKGIENYRKVRDEARKKAAAQQRQRAEQQRREMEQQSQPDRAVNVVSRSQQPQHVSAPSVPQTHQSVQPAVPIVTVPDNRQELREIQAALDTLNKNLSEWKNLEPEEINVSAAELRAAIAEGESLKKDLTGLANTLRAAVEEGTRTAVTQAQMSVDSAKDATIARLQRQLQVTEQNQQMLMARLEKQQRELASRDARKMLLGVSAFGFALGTVIHIWGKKNSWIFVGEAMSYTVAVMALFFMLATSFKTEAAMNLPVWSLDEKVQKLVETPAYFGDKENGIDAGTLAQVIAHAPWVAEYFENYTTTLALMNKYPEMDLSAHVKDFEALPEAQQTNPEYFRRMARAAKLYDRRVEQGIMQKRVDFAKLYLQNSLR